MRRQMVFLFKQKTAYEIARPVLLVLQGFNQRGFARDQSFPNIIHAASERRDPTHAGDAQTHRASLRRTIVALVPPKPNELETAQSNCASQIGRASCRERV